jgi:hypothetical protein
LIITPEKGPSQQNLFITKPPENEPEITVDGIEVAQFVYSTTRKYVRSSTPSLPRLY